MATVRQNPLTGGILTVVVPPTDSAIGVGCAVLVQKPVPIGEADKENSYYEAHAYIGVNAGPTAVSLPQVPDDMEILVVDLPHGMFTAPKEITDAIDGRNAGNPPSGVGPT